jgi:uncharacterized membrane protein YcaP (DUF421 family)
MSDLWSNIFVSDLWTNMMRPEISVVEKMLRPLMVYFFLLIGLRLAGKRELAQLNAIIGQDNSLSGGLIGAVTLLTVNYLTVRFLFSHEKIDRLVEGSPAVLIENGKLCQAQMDKELVTREELAIQAHKQGIPSLDQVESAVLEAGGIICFIRKQPEPDEVRQTELKAELDRISAQLAEIRELVAARG